MYSLGWDYPLHLGVTEAGEGEDGRMKSAIGIGSLLQDGLGDTIRVSLTEDPWYATYCVRCMCRSCCLCGIMHLMRACLCLLIGFSQV